VTAEDEFVLHLGPLAAEEAGRRLPVHLWLLDLCLHDCGRGSFFTFESSGLWSFVMEVVGKDI
jgi:hypothetical protein